MKISIFARYARTFFVLWHLEEVPVLSTTWNDLFCSCVDDVSICWHMFSFVILCPKRWFQINSRTVRRHFSSIMTLNNWKMIAEKWSFIFRWRSRFRRRRGCLSCKMCYVVCEVKIARRFSNWIYKSSSLPLLDRFSESDDSSLRLSLLLTIVFTSPKNKRWTARKWESHLLNEVMGLHHQKRRLW